MAQSQHIIDTPKHEMQPPCPTCNAPMWLVRLSKFDDNHDLRTFKCQVCEHTETVSVKFR